MISNLMLMKHFLLWGRGEIERAKREVEARERDFHEMITMVVNAGEMTRKQVADLFGMSEWTVHKIVRDQNRNRR